MFITPISSSSGEGLDKIPRLMHQLHDSDHAACDFRWDRPFLEKERRLTRLHQNPGHGFVAAKPTGSPPPRKHDGGYNAPPPTPPRRALELVKEGVHRALQAFSTRPLKGFTHPPRPSDLLRPFDVCKDARVTYPEFQAGLRGLGLGLTADESESLARELDSDDTGLVDRKKFESEAMTGWGRGSAEDQFLSGAGKRGSADGCLSKDNVPGADQRPTTIENLEQHKRDNTNRESGNPPLYNGKYISRTPDYDGGARVFPGQKQTGTGNIFAQEQSFPPPPFETRGKATTKLRVRVRSRTPTVSFDQWRRMTRRGSVDWAGPLVSEDSDARSIRSRADYTHRDARGSVHASREGFRLLNTLRSLLGRDDFSDEAIHHCLNLTPDLQRRGDGLHQLQRQDHGDCTAFSAAGNGRKRRGSTLFHGEGHLTRPSSAPPGVGSLKSRGVETSAVNVEHTSKPTSAHDRSQAYAIRAEKTLRLRSRGDLVGLRRAFSRADPSGSGVLSPMEMERLILRRFGAGLGGRDARVLAARYGKDYRGRSMVDYGRLLDNLEAMEADLIERAVGWERPLRRKPKANNPETMGVAMPAAAGSRPRGGNQRDSKRVHDTAGSVSVGKCPPEKSQLVRRAQAKTLALLDRSGTGSIDRVFGLIDSARTGIVSSEQFRHGLRILSGTDPLSDIEYKALFRSICMGQGSIKYRDVIHTLSTAKLKESWEGTQRELARQAELPARGRGSGIHLRFSNVLNYAPEDGEVSAMAGLSGGRRHKEWRRRELQRLRDSVKKLQDGRDGAGQVYEMFQGQGGERKAHTVENQVADCDLPRLFPSALRRGLSSLGVPLGDEDFIALMATLDPERRGEVSYANFCEALRLHQLRDNHGATVARPPTSAAPTLSNQSIGQGLSSDGVVNAGAKGGPRERGVGGSTRRRALDLAPRAEMNLDGGIFHRNPATVSCTNPTFTTTMANSSGDGKYRPRRRQSPALARSSPRTLPGGLTQKGPVDEKVRSPQRWSETAEDAEATFRRCLGMKIRRCTGRQESWDGWDSIGVSSPRQASSSYAVDCHNRGNRRGSVYTPKNNDLGFGSERMRLDSRRGHPCVERFGGVRGSRSLNIDAKSRYGHRAQSTVQHLLRDDSWIEACPDPTAANSRSIAGFLSDGGDKDNANGISQTGWQASPRRASGKREQSNGVTISRRPPQSPPKWISHVYSVAMQGGSRSGGDSRSDGSENADGGGTRARGRGNVASGHRFESSAPRRFNLPRVASAIDALSLPWQGRANASEVFSGQRVSRAPAFKRAWSVEAYGRSPSPSTFRWRSQREPPGDEDFTVKYVVGAFDSRRSDLPAKRQRDIWT